LAVTTTPKSWRGTNRLIGQSPRIKPALGLHPQLVKDKRSELPLFEALLPETKYIGEVGLDGSKEFKNYLPEQRHVFKQILTLCGNTEGKVLSIHSRGAASQVLDLIEQHPYCGHIVLHWFTGTIIEIRRALDLGCWFSVNTAMLKSPRGISRFLAIPKDRVVTESDGPFIADGRSPSSPLTMSKTVSMIANIWKESVTYTDQQIVNNLNMIVDI
jgi:TatD DNase family protein